MRLPIYLDNNATTRVDPEVVETMLPFFSDVYGNSASKTHPFGWRASEALEEARDHVANLVGARPREIVFTSGATESDNLAILGTAALRGGRPRHLIAGETEHKAVLDPCRELERRGWRITRLRPDRAGRVHAAQVDEAITQETALVSLMLANNETGTLHPIREIAEVTRRRGVTLHCDGAQGAGKIPVDVDDLGVDLLSLSAHKLYGPKGIGALYLRGRSPRVRISPTQFGGGHEAGLRSGTVAVPLAVGFGRAAEIARERLDEEGTAIRSLADRLGEGIVERVEGAVRHGAEAERLPGTVNIGFPGVEGDALLLAMPDIAVSTGAACTSAELEPSHVLRAMGVPAALAQASIRFSVGRFNRADEIEYVIDRVVRSVEKLRRVGGTG